MRFRSKRRAPGRLVANVRAGRVQRTLAATVAGAALPLGFEVWLEHYRGSFADTWMWAPIVLTPPLAAAGVAGVMSERAARTVLPLVSGLYAVNGVIGVVTHIRGVYRKPGGFHEPWYNLVMGPPVLAPGSLVLVGALGLAAPLLPRER